MSGPFELLRMARDLPQPPRSDGDGGKLGVTDKCVLFALASRADRNGRSHASHARLARDCWLSARAVREALARLEKAGLVAVQRRTHKGSREKDTNVYRPVVGVRNDAPYLGRHVPDVGQDVPNGTAPGAGQVRNDAPEGTAPGADEVPMEDPKEVPTEVPREEGAALPPPSPGDDLAEGEAFAVADDAAERRGRPKPTRGATSKSAMAQLVAEAAASVADRPWASTADALRGRLDAHYVREDEALQRCKWALKLALQVEQTRIERPREPPVMEKPEPPEPPSPPSDTYPKGVADAYREAYPGLVAEYPAKLAAYERNEAARAEYRRASACWGPLLTSEWKPPRVEGVATYEQADEIVAKLMASLAKSKNPSTPGVLDQPGDGGLDGVE